MPLGLPKPVQMIKPLDTVFISESFSDNITVGPQTKITKHWTLKNTGERYIPKGSKLTLVEGYDYSVNCLPLQ